MGFTEGEARDLCDGHGRDFDAVGESCGGYELQGYVPSIPQKEGGPEPETPRYPLLRSQSAVEAVTTGRVTIRQELTEPYEALGGYITKDLEGLKEKVAILMSGANSRFAPSPSPATRPPSGMPTTSSRPSCTWATSPSTSTALRYASPTVRPWRPSAKRLRARSGPRYSIPSRPRGSS